MLSFTVTIGKMWRLGNATFFPNKKIGQFADEGQKKENKGTIKLSPLLRFLLFFYKVNGLC